MPLSRTAEALEDALSITINQLVYDLKRSGEDIITLSLGEAYFQIPLFDFNALDVEKIHHYSDSKGLPELRRKIARFYGERYDAPVSADEIVVTAGSKAAIFLSALATLGPGDEALIHEPAWLSYPAHVRLAHATPRFIPYSASPKDFEGWFNERTRLLILCNPNNPSGRLYSREDLEAVYRLCRARDCVLLVDEAYSDFTKERFLSIASVAPEKEGVIIANSLSKNMGMSGWRVGYVITEPKLALALEKLNQHVITCAPTILCHYMAHYFDAVIAHTLPQVAEVVAKRERVAALLRQLDIAYLGGDSTFYFFVDLESFPGTSIDFALELLLTDKIAVVPGLAYGESVARFVRISIGAESEARIHAALVSIKRLISDQGYDPAATRNRFLHSGLNRGMAANLLDRA